MEERFTVRKEVYAMIVARLELLKEKSNWIIRNV